MSHRMLIAIVIGLVLSSIPCQGKPIQLKNKISKIYSEHFPAVVSISPDGTKLLLKAARETGFTLDILNIKSRETTTINTDRDGQFSPLWSSDGNSVGFFLDTNGRQDYKLRLSNLGERRFRDFVTPRIVNPSVVWSRDQKRMAFLSESRQLNILDLNGGGEIVYQSSESILPRSSFSWSSDSSSIAYVLSNKPTFVEVRNLNANTSYGIEVFGNVQKIAWLNGLEKLIVTVIDKGERKIFEISPTERRALSLPSLMEVSSIFVSKDNHFKAFNVSEGFSNRYFILDDFGRIAFQGTGSVMRMGEVEEMAFILKYEQNLKKVVSLNLRSKIEKVLYLEKSGSIGSFRGKEIAIEKGDKNIPALLWNSGKDRAPFLIMLHGGPHLNYANTWHPELEVLLSQGVDVLQLNYSGSSGYSDEFLNSEAGAVDDIGATLKFFKAKYLNSRIYLWGDSFGAGLAMAASNISPDLVSGVILTSYFGKFKGAKKLRMPIIAFQGENDYLCSPSCVESKLQDYIGVEQAKWLVPLKEEGHSFRRIDTWTEVMSGIVSFILGRDKESELRVQH